MALDWQPTMPDRIPARRFYPQLPIVDIAAISQPKINPPPDLLHTLWFAPVLHDRVPPRRVPMREFTEAVGGSLTELTTVAPLAWAPTFPARIPSRPGLPSRIDAETAPVPYEVIVAAFGWRPDLPPFPPRRALRQPESTVTIPLVPLAPPPTPAPICVEWGLQGSAATDLTTDALTTSDLLHDALTATDLLGEALC